MTLILTLLLIVFIYIVFNKIIKKSNNNRYIDSDAVWERSSNNLKPILIIIERYKNHRS
jgi:cbb3-type cytochrome oxidase subunit 3